MSVLSLPIWARLLSLTDAPARTDPPKSRRGSPVFIHDAVTPWQGETLLSVLLKRDLAQCEDEPR